MNKSQAETSLKKVASESLKLDPSTLIVLYEIDISELASDITLKKSNENYNPAPFRFHNMNSLNGVTLKFQSNNYISLPIQAEGFEMNSAGTLPTPTLTITSVEGLEENASFSLLKSNFINFENFVGAKVTRIRTFAKFLDADQNGDTIEGVGSEEDQNAEFPRDVFFIERKSNENKNSIQFELSSIFDLQNLKLPSRVIYASRCPFTYRGEGCCYEYKSKLNGPTANDNQTGISGTFGYNAVLPDFAPPVANANDELISGKAGDYTPEGLGNETGSNRFSGLYLTGGIYSSGDVVFIEKNSIKYYFVSKHTGSFSNVCPPHSTYWEPDQCSKTLKGCKLRWGNSGKAFTGDGITSGTAKDFLPFGGFPGTNTRTSIN
jgi:lambda family phage minor tail protein L